MSRAIEYGTRCVKEAVAALPKVKGHRKAKPKTYAAKKTAKKAVKKVTRRPSLQSALNAALKKEAIVVEVSRAVTSDAYIVHASAPRALFSFTVTGRDIDAAGPAIVALLKARILRALA